MVELLDWYAARLPAGVLPANQDGEVAGFRVMAAGELTQGLGAGEFTIDAALILLAAYGGTALLSALSYSSMAWPLSAPLDLPNLESCPMRRP